MQSAHRVYAAGCILCIFSLDTLLISVCCGGKSEAAVLITELAGLQADVGPSRVRRRADAARALGPHLAARHRALQQVSASLCLHADSMPPFSYLFGVLTYSSAIKILI